MLKRLWKSEEPPRRPVIVRVSRKLRPDERTVALEINPPGFLNIIGAEDEGDTEGVAAPIGAPATYAVDLTDAEIERYRQAENCLTVEEDEIHSTQVVEVEPVIGAQSTIGGIPEPAVLEFMSAGSVLLNGTGVRVAVLDGGISPQVRQRMGFNVVAEKNFTGVDTGPDGHTTDHGCMVAPVCVPPGAEVIDLIVGNNEGSSRSAWYAAAVRHAVDNGAKVINYSYGGGTSGGVHRDAARYAQARGAIILCSAGNSGRPQLESPSDLCREFPDTVVSSIAFYHLTGMRASFSCHHADGTLCAPGRRVLSLSATGELIRVSGTSFSCPLTAFVLTVALSYVKGRMTAPEVLQVFKDTARDTPAPRNEEGGGAPNLAAVLDKLKPVPVKPIDPVRPVDPVKPVEPVKPTEPEWLRKLRTWLAMYAVASGTPPWLSRLIRRMIGER